MAKLGINFVRRSHPAKLFAVRSRGLGPLVGMALSLACYASVAAAAPQLIGVDTTTNTLLKIDPATGLGTAIGSVGDAVIGGLAWDSNRGILYGSSFATGSLLRIDPATGATIVIGALGVSQVHGIAYDAAQDELYGVSYQAGGSGFYSIDTTSGHANLIGTHGITDLFGLTFDPSSRTLYGAGSVFHKLYTLNPSTAEPTLVGTFGAGSAVGAALAFDTSLGLFASDNKFDDAPNDQLFSVNPTTAHATLIGNIGWGNVISLAFVPSDVIPEPATAGAFMLLSLILLPRRRR